MPTQPTLTPAQLAALDLMIANKQAAGPGTADSFVDAIVQTVVATAQIVTAVTGAIGGAAATTNSNLSGTSADEINKLQNVSLEQLKTLRSQVTSK